MNLRRLIISGYGPTLFASIGHGAVYPLIPLSALGMGASVPTSALVLGLLGIGRLVGDLPAGVLTARFGEKPVLFMACVVDAAAMAFMYLVGSLWALAVGVFVVGLASAVLGLARQMYLSEAIPIRWRARALSTLGGVHRIGFLVGPLVGAWIVTHQSLATAYGFAGAMAGLAGAVTLVLPDIDGEHSRLIRVRTFDVMVEHARTLATLGVGVLVLSLTRSARMALLPLWCHHIGLDAAQTSLVTALSMAFDVALFFPGGAIMDRLGRRVVAIPAMLIMGVGLLVLPLTQTVLGVSVTAALLGLGNGLSSGLVMTLGSDASPASGRPQFLASWRLLSDTGDALGPVLITGITAVATLVVAGMVTGTLSWLGAGWLGLWIKDRPRG